MWLINTTTMRLENFGGYEPPFAILSHYWGEDEVTFQMYPTEEAESRKGNRKIKFLCRQAQEEGVQYAWIDTGLRSTSALSVVTRMSWAANRQTTRLEDEAYCLLGIFKVNMPILDGEGRNAFRRLQEEIIKTHWDHSIFAWDLEKADSLLAPSVSAFSKSGNITSSVGEGIPDAYELY
ncbi:hypothetical protein F5Y11DRAFT_363999 [Daldinia sp. FL1419]|nr:hypothetical protein F5Y11DRAFT_363999 [Daldinia sp. FL1419]